MRNYRVFFAVVLLSLSCVAAVSAADWPAWRGPNRDGLCQEKGLLKAWPEIGPPLAWKTTGIGEGFGGPAIVGNMLYITGHKDGNQWVYALDVRKDGKQVWSSNFGPVRHNGSGFPGSRATPAIDGDRLYIIGIAGDLVCMDLKDGRIVWQKDLVKDFGGTTPMWGYAESPLVDGPNVICTPGGKDNTTIALSKTDGSVVWHAALGDKADYASVVKATIGGVEQYVNVAHSGIFGVDAKTGGLLWRYEGMSVPPGMRSGANIATCIVSGDSVFAARAYEHGGGRAEHRPQWRQIQGQRSFLLEKDAESPRRRDIGRWDALRGQQRQSQRADLHGLQDR